MLCSAQRFEGVMGLVCSEALRRVSCTVVAFKVSRSSPVGKGLRCRPDPVQSLKGVTVWSALRPGVITVLSAQRF